jgi:hypothetical protein
MMGLATRRDERKVLDLPNRLLEADQLVAMSLEHAPEGCKLHGFLL